MRVLLFSMPDSFEHTPAVAIRMPNGALASLAGNGPKTRRGPEADRTATRRSARSSGCTGPD
jgi:hypothetical protein